LPKIKKNNETETPKPCDRNTVIETLSSYQVSTDGPFNNVIKIKPPLTFSREDGDTLASALDAALTCFAQGVPLTQSSTI
jgi:4-aminobutyrate aminotransferase-like enzyme